MLGTSTGCPIISPGDSSVDRPERAGPDVSAADDCLTDALLPPVPPTLPLPLPL
jgi:hypothetical protein